MANIKSEREINLSVRDHWSRAKGAMQSKNYDYVISLLQSVLKVEPLFYDGRKMLRRAAIEKVKSQKSGFFGMGSINVGLITKLNGISKKTPQEQMEVAEEILAVDPFHEKANLVISEAGEALEVPLLKALGYESIAEGRPDDRKAQHKLAQVYMSINDPDSAGKVYDKILAKTPNDGEALSGSKQAAASLTNKNNYQGKEGNFIESLANPAQARELDNQNRAVNTVEAIDELIKLAAEKFNREPNNLGHPKEIARLCEQKKDLVGAIAWFEHAYTMGGRIDAAMEKHITELKRKQIDESIEILRSQVEACEDESRKTELSQQLSEWETQKKQTKLEAAQNMVKKYPQEGQFRFELGEALYEMGQFRPALQEFQQSLKQPSVRHNALNLMGKSYLALKMNDFAVKQFATCESEMVPMDELKKEVIYNLGRAYDALGQPDKGLEQDKKIYEVDITYRDVADRVERSYGN